MDVDYFIKKFSAIPEDQWTTGTRKNKAGQRCALGHCNGINEESSDLINLFGRAGLSVIATNDGWETKMGPLSMTPKARILAALEYLKALALLSKV